MQWSGETGRGGWIGPRLTGRAGSVGSVVPAGFEAYARILHPPRATHYGRPASTSSRAGLPAGPARWSWARVAAYTGAVMHPEVQWAGIAGGTDDTVRLPGGWDLDAPALGYLEPELLAVLMTVARGAATPAGPLTLGLWSGWDVAGVDLVAFTRAGASDRERRADRDEVESAHAAAVDPAVALALAGGPYLELPGRRYILLDATADELTDPAWPLRSGIGWSGGIPGPMPQLIWPGDRAWFVSSEIDFDSTIVGGTRAFIDAVLADSVLEALGVDPGSDLTSEGDRINRRHAPPQT
ncbi:hypothetical protein E2F48_03215 [Arthrobacter crusticola]|uniref:Uncharacterized protein n=1 Tax=Arthrobacter crusticola TaxID=2547960 RepID=A0A4R5U355_9MICC|nr:hypothetical protein [Arthrobacter crusticola]TDK28120.1 hypothetical protein E2F48_03215 [Arthrobacter crusticola]